MKKLSKRYRNNIKKINLEECTNLYKVIKTLKKTATVKFIESVELHANLNINTKYQQLKTTIILPHNVNKSLKTAVLTTKENFDDAKAADIIGNDELLTNILNNNIHFDILIVTPNMIPKLTQVGKILGPKGLMPSLKSGTITNNLKETILEFKRGKFEYKADKTGVIHIKVGKSNFTEKQLIENLQTLYKSFEKNRPSNIKGTYFKSLFLCTTMGPAIKLNLDMFN
uniref:Ribosomal protein n=1 Tax=Nitzschia alba TaxID=2858 RepID=A0A5C0F4T4_NITAL|nr:50S ribosomal protein L1 [Nitzschia alba]QEI59580.1 50S ribosomal protein L1 [Nitzschia alba]